jgi:hypothetical protein
MANITLRPLLSIISTAGLSPTIPIPPSIHFFILHIPILIRRLLRISHYHWYTTSVWIINLNLSSCEWHLFCNADGRTCRGTLGLSDILIDLTCDYQDISLDNGDPEARYYVHKGMYQSAVNLTSRQSTVHQGLVTALASNPGYGLVVCGHSLGGGVAAAFAIISSTPSSSFKRKNPDYAEIISTPFVTSVASGLPPGRPIHAYAYGPPALASPDLARYAEGLITSVVLNKDVVPCLSLGVLRDLKNIALTLHEEDKVAEEIIGRVSFLYIAWLPS